MTVLTGVYMLLGVLVFFIASTILGAIRDHAKRTRDADDPRAERNNWLKNLANKEDDHE